MFSASKETWGTEERGERLSGSLPTLSQQLSAGLWVLPVIQNQVLLADTVISNLVL